MPVETPCAAYSEAEGKWRRCRVAIEGEDSVKEAEEFCLPKPVGYTTEEYKAYLARATFFGAADRTVQGLAGAVLRKKGNQILPKKVEENLPKMGRSGESYPELKGRAVEEKLATGRLGVMVEAFKGKNAVPYLELWAAEDIINWREEMVGSIMSPVEVVLRETYEVAEEDDRFTREIKTRYRVLRLGIPIFPDAESAAKAGIPTEVPEGTMIYSQEVWEEHPVQVKDPVTGQEVTKTEYVHVDTLVPKIAGGITLDELPFYFAGKVTIEKPPMLDLINTNMAHYRNSADHEWGLHFTGLPTPWAAGFKVPEGGKLLIGSTVAWLGEMGAECGYLEFTGQGLNAIAQAMDSKKKEMAVQGARLLEQSRPGVEAAEALQLRQSGEQSVLANIASDVSAALTKALTMYARWLGVSESERAKINVALNQDFNPAGVDSALLATLFGALQAGRLSPEVWFYNLQRGEVTPEDWTLEDELAAIDKAPPPSPASILPDPAEDEDEKDKDEEKAPKEDKPAEPEE